MFRMLLYAIFFFFKQKTAYEMRISDWSSDVCSSDLPAGLKQAQQLPEPIFTPSTKAAVGDHDQNVSFDAVVDAVGADLANPVRDATLAIYRWAAAYAAERGIIIADTKFQFGDRKSVVEGKSVSVLIDLRGRRTNEQQKRKSEERE